MPILSEADIKEIQDTANEFSAKNRGRLTLLYYDSKWTAVTDAHRRLSDIAYNNGCHSAEEVARRIAIYHPIDAVQIKNSGCVGNKAAIMNFYKTLDINAAAPTDYSLVPKITSMRYLQDLREMAESKINLYNSLLTYSVDSLLPDLKKCKGVVSDDKMLEMQNYVTNIFQEKGIGFITNHGFNEFAHKIGSLKKAHKTIESSCENMEMLLNKDIQEYITTNAADCLMKLPDLGDEFRRINDLSHKTAKILVKNHADADAYLNQSINSYYYSLSSAFGLNYYESTKRIAAHTLEQASAVVSLRALINELANDACAVNVYVPQPWLATKPNTAYRSSTDKDSVEIELSVTSCKGKIP